MSSASGTSEGASVSLPRVGVSDRVESMELAQLYSRPSPGNHRMNLLSLLMRGSCYMKTSFVPNLWEFPLEINL